ncbi:MAG: hypothetical protein ACFFDF_02490 [Candidatus Odinarchaeota archaeon]
MVNFLLLLEKVINYSKDDIDKGETPLIVYKICSCIRETFCLSYAIRKNNVLYLYFQKEHFLIKFEGTELRFLGPDERSQAILLNKILNKVHEKGVKENIHWIMSTPGIYGKKFTQDLEFISFFSSIPYDKINLILDGYNNLNENTDLINLDKILDPINELDFFIIPAYNIQENNKNLIELLKQLKSVKIVSLSMIKSIEDKILYINYRKDQQNIM